MSRNPRIPTRNATRRIGIFEGRGNSPTSGLSTPTSQTFRMSKPSPLPATASGKFSQAHYSTLDPNLLNAPVENPCLLWRNHLRQMSRATSLRLSAATRPARPDPGRHLPSPSGRGRPSRRELKSDEPRPEPRVDEVWSRGKEWSPTLVILGAVAVAYAASSAYFAIAAGQWGFVLVILFLGGVAFLVLSYPACHHARTPGADDSRAGRARLLCPALAPPAALSSDVAPSQHARPKLNAVRLVRRIRRLLEGVASGTAGPRRRQLHTAALRDRDHEGREVDSPGQNSRRRSIIGFAFSCGGTATAIRWCPIPYGSGPFVVPTGCGILRTARPRKIEIRL